MFECEYGKFGIGICYDLRFAELAEIYKNEGCQMIIYPGAFNTTTGPKHWELLQRARATDNQLYVVTCSPANDNNDQNAYPVLLHSLFFLFIFFYLFFFFF